MHWAQTLIGKIALMCLFAAIEFFLFWRTLIQNKLLHGAQRFGQGSSVVPTQTQIVDSQRGLSWLVSIQWSVLWGSEVPQGRVFKPRLHVSLLVRNAEVDVGDGYAHHLYFTKKKGKKSKLKFVKKYKFCLGVKRIHSPYLKSHSCRQSSELI